MKTYSKTDARNAYDRFHGTFWCLNGGTTDENAKNAAQCLSRATEHAAECAAILAAPNGWLKKDHGLLEMLANVRSHLAAFEARMPTYQARLAEIAKKEAEAEARLLAVFQAVRTTRDAEAHPSIIKVQF